MVEGGAIGLILHDKSGNSENLLEQFARSLMAQGVRVGGLVQRSSTWPNGKTRMDLVDLRTDQVFTISQNLGAQSNACCLDPSALIGASYVLRQAIDDRVDLLVVNKFSGMETDGDGLAQEMFAAIAMGMPVLTTLATRYRDKWDQLTEGAGTMLRPDMDDVVRWWAQVETRQ